MSEVYLLSSNSVESISEHIRARNTTIAAKIARLKNYSFGGEYDSANTSVPGQSYFVPHKTLVGLEAARKLAINSPADLFGGVVGYGYQATKAITHGLVRATASQPQGWSNSFPDAVREVVLPGYTAFSVAEAIEAGQLLLKQGNVRVKPTLEAGGRGQFVTGNLPELEARLKQMSGPDITNFGVVLEKDLVQVTTFGIGQATLNHITISYFGDQLSTHNNAGMVEYGGLNLTAIRGDFEDLILLTNNPNLKLAITQAKIYDAAASHFDTILSRRSYDIAQGYDTTGQFYSGVLEQTWRIGGASSSEIAAIEIFQANPTASIVKATSFQTYGNSTAISDQAEILYKGIDPDYGPMQIYHEVLAIN